MTGKLTPKQAIFIEQYLIDANANATRAAIASGVSVKSAAVTASRWLKNPTVAAAIAERQARRAVKHEITAERVLQELAKLAFHDAGNLYDDTGRLKPVYQLDDMTRAAVSSLDVEEVETFEGEENDIRIVTKTKKIKLADKGQNLERLGKHLKLFTDLHEHSGKFTLEQLVTGGDGQGEGSGGEQAA
jgi:phage terminase small subunit